MKIYSGRLPNKLKLSIQDTDNFSIIENWITHPWIYQENIRGTKTVGFLAIDETPKAFNPNWLIHRSSKCLACRWFVLTAKFHLLFL